MSRRGAAAAAATVFLFVAAFAMVMAFCAPGKVDPVTPPAQHNAKDEKNGAIVDGVQSLQLALQSWAADHADLYPAADAVVAGGAFAGYVQHWPNNPVTGQPLRRDMVPATMPTCG